jgi:ribosomal protein S14
MKFKRLKLTKKYSFFFFKNELIQLHLKFLVYSLWNKNINFLFLNKFFSNCIFFFNKSLNNFCIESGRSKNVKKKFWVSRMQIRKLSVSIFFCGLRKSTW